MRNWPYPLETDQETRLHTEVLVLGGGISGCMAAIAAAQKGSRVLLVEKGATPYSGAGGSGCDHWESAATNPCSKVSPEVLTQAMLDDNDGFNNGISHYIECREGYDRLLELEAMGAKIRDTDDEFTGAAFRDEATKFLFAYDYENRFTLRIWGTTFKPAMVREMRRLGVKVLDRVMITSLLTEDGQPGSRCIGATGLHARTGRFYVLTADATVMCMSRPARNWLFSPEFSGLSEFRPTQCIGDGHAMGWRAGVEFAMMEKSVPAEFSAAGRSYPPYAAGNNHNTWYGTSLLDAAGREVPYEDRDGNPLSSVAERFRPSAGQAFFLKGGSVDNPHHAIAGPETHSLGDLVQKGWKLPFYADLTALPEQERQAIWGMMVGEEGKTRVPVLRDLTGRGFDPARDVLQCYGTGWTSASFLPNERQLFGLPGGFFHDWNLMTNLPGLFVAGDALYASNCYGHAAATGHYAGRHAAVYATGTDVGIPVNGGVSEEQVQSERERVLAPLFRTPAGGIGWKELNMAIAKTMQHACGAIKTDDLLEVGRRRLLRYEQEILPITCALNPHELVRLLEVHDILANSQLIVQACLARRHSEPALSFVRGDEPALHPDTNVLAENGQKQLLILRLCEGEPRVRTVPVDWYGPLTEGYAAHADPKRPEGVIDAPAEPVEPAEPAVTAETAAATSVPEMPPARPRRDPVREETEASPYEMPTSAPLSFDQACCIACNRCVEACQVDVLLPGAGGAASQGIRVPTVAFPGECWYCGCCVMACPTGAIALRHPLMNQVDWVPRASLREPEERSYP